MSLTWNWQKRMGTATTANGITLTLYRGNAFMIALRETEETYQLEWFFADKEHMKNCLGFSKQYNECFSHFEITHMKLDTRYKETAIFLQHLATANRYPITIELYNTDKNAPF